MAHLVTKPQLADALGVHPRTVSKWVRQGMPCARSGAPGRAALYDASTCRRWANEREALQRARGADLEEARAAREHWQAKLAEQTHRTRERELLPRAEVEKAWAAERRRIRLAVSKLPGHAREIAASVAGGPAAVEVALRAACYRVLRELAQ